ncbi:DUF1223 domain-containing protein [Ketogulonicigenium vulgare]|uniref:Coproporphyrinogen III oxidase n=1 Tax=Ketogulonicigenium vulgare (strain WSH-001) TaxID=759362 RepID=F9Y5F6_KETVW|nr:DUF1223 domain-containing protein [Ketogulonicigenium vulgare]AEM40709.1 Coproporphyrinogen III oxidase [Ketogulonicigenium vulgare WSH-001]ALJ80879.1 coproporphyrinogen III oxidase [Ketogulonicigenium vulgare]ANW33653.1 coproporphyrinogen III oxidase [Ketogulonicigenium vulgare]AOZ54425.1 Coproporphyrinogen III oxidase [Ketogulonicigenium vulgare]
MKFALGWVAAIAVTAGAAAAEERSPVVVELYTAQGCAACPPADVVLSKLRDIPGVIPLALHVDYWDYIGWIDAFGQAAFTQRQNAYADIRNERYIYTPQMVIDGTRSVLGGDGMAVMDAISAAKDAPRPVALRVERDGNALHIIAETAIARPMIVQLVRYMPEEEVQIEGGENAGQTLTYVNIVTQLEQIGAWDGSAALDLSQNIEGDQPAVILVQEAGPGRILAAATAP